MPTEGMGAGGIAWALTPGVDMGAIEHAKEIADLVKKYNDKELYERIVTLREEIITLREERNRLTEQVAELQEAMAVDADLVRDGNVYYIEEGEGRHGPYCMACWDYDRKLVNLSVSNRRRSGGGVVQRIDCTICRARVVSGRGDG